MKTDTAGGRKAQAAGRVAKTAERKVGAAGRRTAAAERKVQGADRKAAGRTAADRKAAGRSAEGDQMDPPRRRWPVYLAAVLVLLLVGAASYLLWFTSVLGLRNVSVSGATGDLAAEVRVALNIPEGTPLVKVDLRAAAARVQQLPQVASAQVGREWPNGLRVDVLVRTPVAVTSANGGLWLLDSGGRPYLRVPSAPAGLTTVELATPGATDPATAAALTVINSMTSDFRATVSTVRAPSVFAITVQLKDGRSVIWGGPEDGARKMQVLPALLKQPGTTYDISDPTLATVKTTSGG